MDQKVVHVPSDVHAIAKKHCEARKLKMSEWVTQLIREATGTAIPKYAGHGAPVGKRTSSQPPPPVDHEAIISGPPFWETRECTPTPETK